MRRLRIILLFMCISIIGNAQYTWDFLGYCKGNAVVCNDPPLMIGNTCATTTANSFSFPEFGTSNCSTGWNNQVLSTQPALSDGQKYCFEISNIDNTNFAGMVGIDQFGGTTNWTEIDCKFYVVQPAPTSRITVYQGTTSAGNLFIGNVGDLNGMKLCIEIVGNDKIFSIDGGAEITLTGAATAASYFLQSNIYRAGSYPSPVTISNIEICE